jgi:C7-cyclitol 7-kinase
MVLSSAGVCLAFDVGGTRIRAATFAPGGALLAEDSAATPSSYALGASRAASVRELALAAIARLGEQLTGGRAPGTVAIGFPGPIDPEGTVAAAVTTWPDPGVTHLGPWAARTWPGSRRCFLNDVTAAGYRYVAEGCRDFCVVTVGSGVGHKVFVDAAPLLGPRHRGGEIGHLRVDFGSDAPLCECGGRGHVGAIASGRGALAAVRRAGERDPGGLRSSRLGEPSTGRVERVTNEQVVAAFRSGDRWTTAVVADCAAALGRALAAIHLATGTECFFLEGGFATALGQGFVDLVADGAREASWRVSDGWAEWIRAGADDDRSGVIGAAYAARLVPCG